VQAMRSFPLVRNTTCVSMPGSAAANVGGARES
jgi:hypothetical protein